MPTFRYSGDIIEWMKEEVKEMDRKTRKIITICGGIHPRSNVEWLYLPRREGSRGLLTIEDCINNQREDLALYACRSNEKRIIAATTELKLKKFINVQNRQEGKKQRLIEWKRKTLHGQLLRETESTDDRNRWAWLKRGELKREKESLLCAAQEEALRVSAIKYSIDKTRGTPLVQFWLKVNLENAITRLGSTCTGCCVRSITYNAVTSGTYTHHNPSRKKTSIKSFGVSIFKEIRL